MVFQLELFGGLAIFALYIIFDTQLIVERASAGDFDEVKDAQSLFIDFVAVFARILIIMLQKEERKNAKKRSDKRE